MNRIAIIFIMILLFAGFLPGFVGPSAPLYDRGGISYLSCVTALYGEDKSGVSSETTIRPQDDSAVLYKVMAITLIIWAGISAYLIFLHVKIAALEKKSNE